MIAPEDAGVSANLAFGAFSPTVWKSGAEYNMLLVGRKFVSGTIYQTKILNSASDDGINWSGPSPAINQSGTSSNFDYSNLDGPDLLQDPGQASPFKVYYAGNTVDANGNFHTRIGYATSVNGNSFSKVGSGPGVNADGSVLDIGTLGTAFDSRTTSGMTAVVPAGAPAGKEFVGAYSGIRGADFTPRLGGAYSADGSSWTRVSDGTATGGSLLPLGNAPANFDLGGHTDPSLLYESAAASQHRLYFTAINGSGVKSIATSATTEDVDKQPVNSGWSAPSRIFQAGSGFDANAVSHPSVIKDGATYRMLYTGTDGSGVMSIGYTESASATSFAGTRTQVVAGASGIDAGGVKDPVAWKAGVGDYRMIYTAISVVDGKRTERLAYASSANGSTWTKASPSLVLDPSLKAFAFDESSVSAGGIVLDGSTPHVWYAGTDRSGRTRVGHATSSGASTTPSGAATYQLGDPTTSVRDFRSITRTSSGTVTLWLSFLQPYSSAGEQYWSDYFPVTAAANPETLNVLLNVHGVRWQARLSDPVGNPSLDTVAISHAPVTFSAAGSTSTLAISPPINVGLNNWSSATVNASLFQPNGTGSGTGTIHVRDAASAAELATASLNTGGDRTIDLSAISPAAHPQLRFAFDLVSADGQATPLLNSLQVAYNGVITPTVVTLTGSAPSVIYGQPLTLTGTVAKGARGLAGQVVSIQAAPAGSTSFAPVTTATTDASGAYTVAVIPDKALTYKASVAAGSNEPTVGVTVAHLVKLKVTRKGTKGYVSGSVGPPHAAKPVQLQQKKGSRWVTIKKLKTSSKSKFSTVVKKLSRRGKYQFRALTAADTLHLAGKSDIYYVDKIKLSLSIKRSGRTLSFSGAASPSHPGKVVAIKVLKGTTWSTLAKVKLSRRSTYSLKKKFAAGTYDFRADIAGDRDHWPGRSAVRRVMVP